MEACARSQGSYCLPLHPYPSQFSANITKATLQIGPNLLTSLMAQFAVGIFL